MFEQQFIRLTDRVELKEELLKVEVSFDTMSRPVHVVFYNTAQKDFFWFEITYLSAFEYTANFVFRKLSEPTYRGYYTVKHYMDRHILKGLLVISIFLIFIFSAIVIFFHLFLCIYTRARRKNLSTRGKVIAVVIIGLSIYVILSYFPYGLLVLLPIVIIGGCIKGMVVLFRKLSKRT